LFITHGFWEAVRAWTKKRMKERKFPDSARKIIAGYLELETGMLLVRFNSIESYWSTGAFLDHDTFKRMMSHQTF